MDEPKLNLRTHRAPPDLVQRAVLRASMPRPPRAPVIMLAAACFLGGLGLGAWGMGRGGEALPAPAVAAAPAGPAARVVAAAPSPSVAKVPVRFVFPAATAERVAVAGTWNDWDPAATPLVRGEGGVFYVVVHLPPGQYEYQFVVNGREWTTDPASPHVRDDGYGQRNSVLTI